MTIPEDKRERVERLRKKQARGETLTRKEAGFLGAVGAMEKDQREREAARREGRLDEWKKETGVASWTNAPGEARPPTISQEDEARARRLREKKEESETLTRQESGFLGAYARMEEEQE